MRRWSANQVIQHSSKLTLRVGEFVAKEEPQAPPEPTPAPQPLVPVDANLFLKGMKVGRNRKHRRAIVARLAQQRRNA